MAEYRDVTISKNIQELGVGDVAYNIIIDGSGSQYVGGGCVYNTKLYNRQTVTDGGIASTTTIFEYGKHI